MVMTSILMVLLSIKQSLKSLIMKKQSVYTFFFFYGADIGGCSGVSAPGSEAVCVYKVNKSNNAFNNAALH